MEHDAYASEPGVARCTCGWYQSFLGTNTFEMAVWKVDLAVAEHMKKAEKKRKGKHLRSVA